MGTTHHDLHERRLVVANPSVTGAGNTLFAGAPSQTFHFRWSH